MDVIKHYNQLNDLDFKFDNHLISKINFFIIFDTSNLIIVLKDDSVFGFGNNFNGKLGFGHRREVKELTQSKYLSNQHLIDICFGRNHVLGLTRSGRCISWGFNNSGELGYKSKKLVNKPKLIEYFTENNLVITSISCGLNHSMVLTNNGVVYTFGNNDYKQLGSEERKDFPQKVKIKSITAISCGLYYCSALNTSGQVFIWGNNYFRQCSQNVRKYCQPLIVEIPVKVTQISSANILTLVLTEDKHIYSIGCIECFKDKKRYNKCRHNSNIINKPFGNQEFTAIASHSSFNLFIVKSIDGNCYEWGFHKNDFKDYQKSDYNCLDFAYSILTSITYKTIVLPEIFIISSFNKLQNNVTEIFDNQKDSDFVFKFNDKQIFVHKFILKMQCKHFQTLFSENWTQNTNEMEITPHSYPTYYAFIKYLYTQCVELNNVDVYELYDLANSYFEKELKSICLKAIEDNISMENVLIVFSFSQIYELQSLELNCLEFCSNKWNQLFLSEHYETFDENITRKLIRRAAQLELFQVFN